MIADFEFYKNNFKGIIITTDKDYEPFAERAGDELARYVGRISDTDEAQTALKRCACRIADILYGDFKLSKYGSASGKISSESVSGYYSVTYGNTSGNEALKLLKYQINTAIALYLGKWLLKSTSRIIY